MLSVGVYLNRPPHNVRLVGWGRADDGWWGCITWLQRVRTTGDEAEIGFAAWVPAPALALPTWSTPIELPRTVLEPDRKTWPAPLGWPAWYVGVWPDGRITGPPGVTLVTGAAWRERRRPS